MVAMYKSRPRSSSCHDSWMRLLFGYQKRATVWIFACTLTFLFLLSTPSPIDELRLWCHCAPNQQHQGTTTAFAKDRYMLQCLQTNLANLPIGPGPKRKQVGEQMSVWTHHYDARNLQKWNAAIRLDDIPQMHSSSNSSRHSDDAYCSFWEVGAHRKADDSRVLIQEYPHCQFHAYEPIPDFFTALQGNWKGVSNMKLHNYGLGDKDSTFYVSKQSLKSQATYLGKEKQSDPGNQSSPSDLACQIKSFSEAVKDSGGQIPTVFHVNCEGCEWEMIPQMIQAGFLQQIPVIQISMHNYGGGGVGPRAWQLCEMRYMMSQSHDLQEGDMFFGWERWIKRESATTAY